MNIFLRWLFLFVGFALLLFSACERRVITVEKGDLLFSADTVKFDTIFTTIKAPTEWLAVTNNTGNNIKVARIWLGGGAQSDFDLIIDGVKTIDAKEVILPAKDSIYVFVSMKSNAKDRFVEDYIHFKVGEKEQKVLIRAYIMDAYFHATTAKFTFIDGVPQLSYDTAFCDVVMRNDKPHVIDGPFYVPEGCTLTIEAGTQVHFTPYKLRVKVPGQLATYIFFSMIHVAGTLKVKGQPGNPVVLQQSRLQTLPEWSNYTEQPGQWRGIWLTGISKDNEIEHALLKNGMFGIQIDSTSVNGNPKLTLRRTEIRNQQSAGVATVFYNRGGINPNAPTLLMDNCLIYNCSGGAFSMSKGGWVEAYNCTFDNSGRFSSKNGTVGVFNYYSPEPGVIEGPYDIKARFVNCNIFGNSTHELVVGDIAGAQKEILFQNCLVKLDESKYNYDAYFQNVLKNQNPKYAEVSKYNYRLKAGSPCIDAGEDLPQLPLDLRGRADSAHKSPFDIGAFEFY